MVAASGRVAMVMKVLPCSTAVAAHKCLAPKDDIASHYLRSELDGDGPLDVVVLAWDAIIDEKLRSAS